MADNLLKRKAIGNYFNRMGWYSGEMSGEIEPSPEHTAISSKKMFVRKKYVKVGKSKMKILGM